MTKLGTKMFHQQSQKCTYFGGQKVKVSRHKKQYRRGLLHSCECWLLLVHTASNALTVTTKLEHNVITVMVLINNK